MSNDIKPPRPIEFMVRGYNLIDALAIIQRWDELTPVERGQYMFPLPLPEPPLRKE